MEVFLVGVFVPSFYGNGGSVACLERFAGLESRKSVDMSPFWRGEFFCLGFFWAIFSVMGLESA